MLVEVAADGVIELQWPAQPPAGHLMRRSRWRCLTMGRIDSAQDLAFEHGMPGDQLPVLEDPQLGGVMLDLEHPAPVVSDTE